MKRWICMLALALLGACPGAPDMEHDLFNRGEMLYVDSPAAAAALEKQVIAAIDQATIRVWTSFERLTSEPVAQALLRAQGRGVDVRVLSDVDRRKDAGIALLVDKLGKLPNGSPRVVLMGGPLSYSPTPTLHLERTSAMNVITHTFVLIDTNHLINLSEGFGSEGHLRWGFVVHSTDVAKDFEDEHSQVFGGVSATTLNYYDGVLKSNNNNRVYYPMQNGVWEVYFGPQERLMKRIIDEVYAARASVQIITPLLSSTFLVDALRYKARVGGIVDVMVDKSSLEDPTSRFEELAKAIQDDKAQALMRVGEKLGTTVVVIDADKARDGRRYQTRVLVLSHALVESIPFDANNNVRPSDAFMDGNMWVLSRPSSGISELVEQAIGKFDATFARGQKP